MSIRVRVSVNHAAIGAVMRSPQGPPARYVDSATMLVELYAKSVCPVDEGTLRNSITRTVAQPDGNRMVGTVFTLLKYAKFVHGGTGIYGPRRAWIYPRNGRFLMFEVKRPFGPMPKGKSRPAVGSRPVVFARRVRGMPPMPFLVIGMELALPGVQITRFPARP